MKIKLKLFIAIVCMNFSCSCQIDNSNTSNLSNQNGEIVDTANVVDQVDDNLIIGLQELSIVDASVTYSSIKKSIADERIQLRSSELSSDSLQALFKTSLLNKIIPFWEGTPWSFEGHTSKPKIGEIACGYFVSTTLQDVGLQLNRYRLAQQSPINEAKSLAVGSIVKEFAEDSTKENIVAIDKYLEEGIHFIGFDQNHVGYILKDQGQLYLIHSNYINAVGVEIEHIEDSEVFRSYARFYIVPLSTNEDLINYWINDNQIQVVGK